MSMCVRMCVCVYVFVYMCMRAYVCVCVCVCVCVLGVIDLAEQRLVMYMRASHCTITRRL